MRGKKVIRQVDYLSDSDLERVLETALLIAIQSEKTRNMKQDMVNIGKNLNEKVMN